MSAPFAPTRSELIESFALLSEDRKRRIDAILWPDEYIPFGGAAELLDSKDPEVLICGGVGGGKTRAGLEMVHRDADAYPRSQQAIVRQTRRSISMTMLTDFERFVLPEGHPARDGGDRTGRSKYTYPNGAEIWLIGMDDPQKLMSSQFDRIYIGEMTDLREDDIELAGTRLRNGIMPYQQLAGDCNPQQPNHWLKLRCEKGLMRMIDSSIKDNPRYWDGVDWTPEGAAYMARNRNLSDIRYQRLILNKWVAAEGSRFKSASKEVQGFTMREKFPYGFPQGWKRWTSGDWGRAAPFCCLWHCAGFDSKGSPHVYTYLEAYEKELDADEQAELIVEMSPSSDAKYEVMQLDGSMWQAVESFGAKRYGDGKEPTPAAEKYAEVFAKANESLGYDKFPVLKKGPRNTDEQGYVTLESMLRSGQWSIEKGCTNLWRELEDAVYYKNPRTGFLDDLINPGNNKFCDDHALMASVYALHKRSPTSEEDSLPVELQLAQFERERLEQRRRDADRRHSETARQPARYRTR